VPDLWHTIYQDMLVPGVPVAEKALRTLGVYVFLLVGLRVAGKRELGQLNPFDLVVLLVLSNTVQNAIIGNDNSLVGGLLGAAILLGLNYAVVRVLYRHPTLNRLIAGDPAVLVEDGKIMQRRLARELITKAQLESAARRQGIENLAAVKTCRLETGGALTFVSHGPSDDDRRFQIILERLDAIEAKVGHGVER
jgi:uncharacterized membrane protein YcaP (DUF421 family)